MGFGDVYLPFGDPRTGDRDPAGPRRRRRRWSDFEILINTNMPTSITRRQHGAEAAQARTDILSTALRRVINAVFSDPQHTTRFMEAQNVRDRFQIIDSHADPDERSNWREVRYRDAGDRFDDTHVFDNMYWIRMESGRKFGSAHAHVTFRVLHDSAFWVNKQTLAAIIRHGWHEAVRQAFFEDPARAARSEMTLNGFLRNQDGSPKYPAVVWAHGKSTDSGAFYNEKENTELQAARWRSAPVHAWPASLGARQRQVIPPFPEINPPF